MRRSSMLVPALAGLLAIVPVCKLGAQTFAANTGTEAIITTTPDPGTPHLSVPGHHPHTSEPLMYGRVRDGVYTVDGMVAKLQLNYNVDGAKFLYMFVPGAGTAVLSLVAAPEAINTEAKLRNNELSFVAGDHNYKLTGVAIVTDKGAAPAHLYAHLDRAAWALNKHPMLGFGNAGAAPYIWPGVVAGAPAAAKAEDADAAPPVPASLLPSTKTVVPRAAAVAVTPVALQSAVVR